MFCGEVNANFEVSDSISIIHTANKRPRHGSNGISSQYKGIMRQENGQWGAQLYANNFRFWLGSFKTEKDAAMAYDSAAIRFRNGDNHRNFPWTDVTVQESKFQSQYSDEAVVAMIKNGSYQCRLMDFLKAQSRSSKVEIDLDSVGTYNNNNKGVTCKQLFQKELTQSDVGKLNRLVIPKKFAVKYFPPVSGSDKKGNNIVRDGNRSKVNDVELVFYDKFMRLWKFRYCCWNSSQSFVFTRGWNRFKKEKGLKANDVISFYACECVKGNEVQRFCIIDSSKFGNDGSSVEAANLQVGREVDLRLGLGDRHGFDGEKQVKQEEDLMEAWPKQEQELIAERPKAEGFKLFGEIIIID